MPNKPDQGPLHWLVDTEHETGGHPCLYLIRWFSSCAHQVRDDPPPPPSPPGPGSLRGTLARWRTLASPAPHRFYETAFKITICFWSEKMFKNNTVNLGKRTIQIFIRKMFLKALQDFDNMKNTKMLLTFFSFSNLFLNLGHTHYSLAIIHYGIWSLGVKKHDSILNTFLSRPFLASKTVTVHYFFGLRIKSKPYQQPK
jgi:hypothetical protein